MATNPRVCHLTSVHPRDDVRIFGKMCTDLAAAGYPVRLIVADGKGNEQRNGVEVRDAGPRPVPPLRRMRFSAGPFLKEVLRNDADIYHFHDPELLAAGAILRMRGKRVIYDAHEHLYYDLFDKDWIPAPVRLPLALGAGGMERLLAGRMTAVVAATPAIARRFPGGSCTVVRNVPRLEEFEFRDYHLRKRQIVYIGGISEIRGVRELMQCAARLEQKKISVAVAGRFSSARLEQEIRATAPANVTVMPTLDRAGVRELLASSAVGMVTLHPRKNYLYSYPVKLFEYMASGLPVVASRFPVWQEIIGGADCGLCVDPFDVGETVQAVEWLLDHPAEAAAMGQRGRAAVEERYCWERERERLLGVYRSIWKA